VFNGGLPTLQSTAENVIELFGKAGSGSPDPDRQYHKKIIIQMTNTEKQNNPNHEISQSKNYTVNRFGFKK
jgi:hypothetical protein